jgi:glucose/arabinose dehydrogenase
MLANLLAIAALQSSPPLYFEPVFDTTVIAAADRLDDPTDIVAFPGDDRIFATQERGKVRIIQGDQLLQQPFVDLVSLPGTSLNLNLLGITLHPAFDVNGFVYLWYWDRDSSPTGSMRLARITAGSLDPNVADPATWVELLSVPVEAGIHFGGRIAFGPDGMFWIGVGDGETTTAPTCSSQDMTRLAGKMLRIDVDSGFPYVVPPDNPFVGVPGVAPEIVHSGLRHPWKWSFDDVTGDLWIGEIGGSLREEVNFAAAGEFGLNFGWPAMEGSLCQDSSGCQVSTLACDDPAYTDPVFEYPHNPGCAITGGLVYSGDAVPWLRGWFLCADLCTNQMWRIRRTPLGDFEVVEQPVVADFQFPSAWSSVAFAADGFGELLFLDYQEDVVRRLRGACAAERTCDGALNVTGLDAKIRWIGSTSLGISAATVYVTDLPAFSPALLFYGPLDDLVSMGNGSLCVGGTLSRASVDMADGSGTSQFDLDFSVAPFSAGPGRIDPGSTWTFQAWYRDVGGPLGATFNFSGATRVTFCL